MPTQGPIHVDRPLTNISIAYKAEGLIADQLFPAVPVAKESDSFFIFDKANSMRIPLTERANGAEANEDNLLLSTATYRIAEEALKEVLSDRDRDNQDPGLNLEVSIVEELSQKLLVRREVDAADLVFTNGNWANESSLAAAGAWSANTSVSSPILNALSAGSAIITNSGMKANVCVLDQRTFDAVKEHTSVVDRIKYTSADSVSESLIANLFNVAKLYVAYGTRNTANEGLAATMANIWTDSAWFGHVERAPGLRKPSALYAFKKGSGVEVRRYRDEARRGEWFEVSHMFDQQSPASDCGYLVVDTVQ